MNQEPHCELSAIAAGQNWRKYWFGLPDQHTECAKRRNENRGRKCIRGEVGDFSNGHWCILLALSPRNFQPNDAGFIHVTTPPHQIGLFKYENPSPSKPCCLLACCKPCNHHHQRSGPTSIAPRSARWRVIAAIGPGISYCLQSLFKSRRTFFVITKLVPSVPL